MNNPPTGIIRTLPSLYADSTNVGHRKHRRAIAALEAGRIEAIFIALAQQPKYDVLFMYVLIGGKIEERLNIAGYEAGDARKCWDSTIRKPKVWAVCTGPVSRPQEPIKKRGFQGFRYTEELW